MHFSVCNFWYFSDEGLNYRHLNHKVTFKLRPLLCMALWDGGVVPQCKNFLACHNKLTIYLLFHKIIQITLTLQCHASFDSYTFDFWTLLREKIQQPTYFQFFFFFFFCCSAQVQTSCNYNCNNYFQKQKKKTKNYAILHRVNTRITWTFKKRSASASAQTKYQRCHKQHLSTQYSFTLLLVPICHHIAQKTKK